MIRLGGPNFAQIPINRPVVPVTTNERDGYYQTFVYRGRTSYTKNSLGGGCPAVGGPGAFSHYQEKVEGYKIRKRSASFQDHYSQPTLFWNSMSDPEKAHIIAAFRFELGKVRVHSVRETVLGQLNYIDHELAVKVAEGIGLAPPEREVRPNHGRSSPALSQLRTTMDTVATRKVAILVVDGVDGTGVRRVAEALRQRGAIPELIAPTEGTVRSSDGADLRADWGLNTMASVLYDAVVVPNVPDRARSYAGNGDAVHFVAEAFKHGKPIAAFGTGVELLDHAGLRDVRAAHGGDALVVDQGVVTSSLAGDSLPDEFMNAFVEQLAQHRIWQRHTAAVPA